MKGTVSYHLAKLIHYPVNYVGNVALEKVCSHKIWVLMRRSISHVRIISNPEAKIQFAD